MFSDVSDSEIPLGRLYMILRIVTWSGQGCWSDQSPRGNVVNSPATLAGSYPPIVRAPSAGDNDRSPAHSPQALDGAKLASVTAVKKEEF